MLGLHATFIMLCTDYDSADADTNWVESLNNDERVSMAIKEKGRC